MPDMKNLGPAFGALVFLALAGCYEFRPVEAAAPLAVGAEVRLHLTDSAGAELAGALGPQIASVRGVLLQSGQDTLLVHVSSALTPGGGEVAVRGRVISLLPSSIRQLDRRALAPGRSVVFGVLVAGGVAGAIKLVDIVTEGGRRNTDPTKPPPTR